MSGDDREPQEPGLTAMLRAWSRGEGGADAAADLLYKELHRRARARLRGERDAATVSPTDLIHEVYVRLLPQQIEWSNRDQFFAAASCMMRRVLVDHARARLRKKRSALRVELNDELASVAPRATEVLAIDDALTALAVEHERQATLVELLFFGGLSQQEAAAALSISLATAKRDWQFARAWLVRRLRTVDSASS